MNRPFFNLKTQYTWIALCSAKQASGTYCFSYVLSKALLPSGHLT